MTDALPQLRARLTKEQAERARHRAEYERIGLGSLDPAFGAATARYAAADVRCARLEDQIKQLERRTQRAA